MSDLWVIGSGLRSRSTRSQPLERPADIAMAHEGPRLAVLASLAALRVDGLVMAGSGGVVATIGEIADERDPLERAVHAAAAAALPVWALRRRRDVVVELDAVAARLTERGLRAHEPSYADRRARWTPIMRVRPRSGRRVVRAELARLRVTHAHLAPASAPSWAVPGDAAMGVALFGESALRAAEPAFATAILGPPDDSGLRDRRSRGMRTPPVVPDGFALGGGGVSCGG